MKRKEIITHQYVDEFGEVKQTTEVVQYQEKRQYLNNGPFVTMWQNALIHLAICDLSPREKNLLMLLMGECGQDNRVEITNSILANKLGYKDTSNVSKSLQKLERRGYILMMKSGYHKDSEQRKTISIDYDQLNVNLVYKGKIENFKKLAAAQSTPITDGDGKVLLDNQHRIAPILSDTSTFDKQRRLFE